MQTATALLQMMVQGASQLPKQRAGLISLEQLVATLTETILTISELEALVKSLNKTDDNFLPAQQDLEGFVLSRVRFVFNQSKTKTLIERLSRNKASSNLMFNIIQW